MNSRSLAAGVEIDQRRARLLFSQGKFQEAEGFFRAAVARSPEETDLLAEFSLCLHCLGNLDEAEEVVDKAVRLAPNDGNLHGQKALILADREKFFEALKVAERGLVLAQEEPLPHAAMAEIYAGMHEWAKAEVSAREALARDSEHMLAQNVLSQALLMQDKVSENDEELKQRLASDPENPYTHVNAGRAALVKNDLSCAEQHFYEALRLDPNLEEARKGLIDAFRTRSPIYRRFLKFSMLIAKWNRRRTLFFVIAALLTYQLLVHSFALVSPWMGGAIACLYLLFVFWSFLGRALGTLIVLADRSARNALTAAEVREGVFGGGCFVVGLIVFGVGVLFGKVEMSVIGVALASCALPLSVMFSNRHPMRMRLYPWIASLAIGAFAFLVAAVVAPAVFPTGWIPIALVALGFCVVATTWLANLGIVFESA